MQSAFVMLKHAGFTSLLTTPWSASHSEAGVGAHSTFKHKARLAFPSTCRDHIKGLDCVVFFCQKPGLEASVHIAIRKSVALTQGIEGDIEWSER